MKTIKNILARLLAFWALLTFIGTFLIIYIPSMFTWLIPDPKGQDIFIKIARVWMRVWLFIVGCKYVIKGKENFKKGKSYVVTCNHNSFIDVPLSSPFIQGPNKTIAKSTFKKIPIFNFYYLKGGVMVDRKNEASRRKSYEEMKSVLNKGIHMCIYPEGTRNRTEEPLKKFHDGAFRLAIETKHDIIPAIILNTKQVLPANKTMFFWPGKIQIHFLPAVSSSNKTIEELREEIFAITKEYYLKNDPGYKN
jgi:1-acyl-sn-glycerol-3-phosphate acyltransferase